MDDVTLWKEFRRLRIYDHRSSPPPPFAGETAKKPPCRRGYFLVLECLAPGKGKTQKEIAEAVGIRAQSLSEALAGMEEKGLIQRVSDAEDRRAIRVLITEAGLRFRDERKREIKLRAEELFRPLSEEEKQTMYDMLRKLRRDAREEE